MVVIIPWKVGQDRAGLNGLGPDHRAPRSSDTAVGLCPRCGRRTQPCTVSALQPIFVAIEVMAAHSELRLALASRARRTARAEAAGPPPGGGLSA
ncbi:MAG: hypothetical protein KC549_16905 [Myxococcales bacterium]|nr:hypothetical protein [Myxococcales bacterium]